MIMSVGKSPNVFALMDSDFNSHMLEYLFYLGKYFTFF